MKILDYRQKDKIDWENLEEGDVIYIYIPFQVKLENVPFEMEMNICFLITFNKTFKVYYGMDVVEEIIRFGRKAGLQNYSDLIPELYSEGYKQYDY